jgi:hypothetical protein
MKMVDISRRDDEVTKLPLSVGVVSVGLGGAKVVGGFWGKFVCGGSLLEARYCSIKGRLTAIDCLRWFLE